MLGAVRPTAREATIIPYSETGLGNYQSFIPQCHQLSISASATPRHPAIAKSNCCSRDAEPVARQPTAPPDSSMIARILSAAAFRSALPSSYPACRPPTPQFRTIPGVPKDLRTLLR
jgi:hypothetical protein